MRTVFQLPARLTSCAEAPHAASSLASPTRPKWAVRRASMLAPRAAAATRSLMACAQRPMTRAAGSTSPQGAGHVALDEAHVGRLAVGVRLAAADGDEQTALLARVGHIPPLERRVFRAAQPGHEEQPGDDAVDPRTRLGACGDLETAARARRPAGRREDGCQVRGRAGCGLAAAALRRRKPASTRPVAGPAGAAGTRAASAVVSGISRQIALAAIGVSI